MLIKKCVCDGINFEGHHENNINMMTCQDCGVMHQEVMLSYQQYEEFYNTDYHKEYQEKIGLKPYNERYDHDRKIAKIRLGEYSKYMSLNDMSLDIGCGNGAFVDEMRYRGFKNSYGQDIAQEAKEDFLYTGQLKSIHFPTEHFNFVTIHDALEHIVDLNDFMTELNRIVKMDGVLVLDFPDYFDKSGKHHWRPIQHLWYFNKEQLVDYLKKFGFYTKEIKKPIPSKLVLYLKKEKDILSTGHKILLLPGMGDIYWVATKLESFCKKKGIVLPEVYVWDFDNRPRSKEFVERIPFVKFGGYYKAPVDDSVIRDSYLRHCRKGIVKGYKQFDYYISVNGLLRDGYSLCEEEFKEYNTNWYYDMFEPVQEKLEKYNFKNKYGDYVVFYFSDLGMFKSWVRDVNQKMIYNTLKSVVNTYDVKVILTGCKWDKPFSDSIKKFDTNNEIVCLTGQTNIDSLFGLMKGAKAVCGWCGGNTIISTKFKIPTVMWWNKYFRNKNFWNFSCPPDSLGKWYFPQGSEDFESRSFVSLLGRFIR